MTSMQYARSTSTYSIPSSSIVEDAIRSTLIYADVFDFPLTVDEIYRYLIGLDVSRVEIKAQLNERLLPGGRVMRRGGYFMLPGRGIIGDRRESREYAAKQMQGRAIRFGRWISHLPFIRMVALTGSLAALNHRSKEDFDYFIITEQGYLWLARGFILLLNRFVSNGRSNLCPNYLISENNLALAERDLYTAQELVRMILISGEETYARLRDENRWADKFLPNASGPPQAPLRSNSRRKPLQILLEPLLKSPIGRRMEAWEMQRKIAKLSELDNFGDEVGLSADQCKGHFDGHRARTMEAYAKKLADYV